jgi:hypothetical protein
MTTLPAFTCYTDHTSKNYGLNSLCFSLDGRDFYFSYQTLVAFRTKDGAVIMRENQWGPTTGKHLNAISRTAPRVSETAFAEAYTTEMTR